MCAVGIGSPLLIGQLAACAARLAGKIVVFPTLDTGTLMPRPQPRIQQIATGPKRRLALQGRKWHG